MFPGACPKSAKPGGTGVSPVWRLGLASKASAATGGVLLLAADLAARTVAVPQELPVGVLTAVIGGGYLLRLLQRSGGRE